MKYNDDELAVHSIFPSIQGEGPLVGTPSVFVRLAGCNLKCAWCDTDYSLSAVLNLDEIARRIKDRRSGHSGVGKLVVLTGGEPLMQNVLPLIRRLRSEGYRIQIETNGTYLCEWAADLRPMTSTMDLTIVCSPKTPLQTEMEWDCEFWGRIVWKYVLSIKEGVDRDYIPLNVYRPPREHRGELFVQPMDEGDEDRNAANLDLCVAASMAMGYRLGVQLHKVVGLE